MWALPGCLPALRRFVTVLDVVGATSRPGAARPVWARLTVTTADGGLVVPGDDMSTRRDRIRAGLLNAGLLFPELRMAVTWNDPAMCAAPLTPAEPGTECDSLLPRPCSPPPG
ncbi:hypothetical protein [Frankia sp. Cj3]|uniref:hypothetical protein n=1 Tax=Frankia sp. Cj3 TaxID=2880976 RepID=UPI001EF5CA68|nr:hypothetical protein [Frankia sp. Cj3]